jgi:hypothetical protein
MTQDPTSVGLVYCEPFFKTNRTRKCLEAFPATMAEYERAAVETQQDPAPFIESEGHRVYLLDKGNFRDLYRFTKDRAEAIEAEWQTWKENALSTLAQTEKPETLGKIAESLEQFDGVRHATLKRRIAAGVIPVPSYATATARRKACDEILAEHRNLRDMHKLLRRAYIYRKIKTVADAIRAHKLEFALDKSRRYDSYYFHLAGGFSLRISDHNHSAEAFGKLEHHTHHADLRLWHSDAHICTEVDKLVERIAAGDYTYAKNVIYKTPEGQT